MAGSIGHVRSERGVWITDNYDFVNMIENLGDAFEMYEEMRDRIIELEQQLAQLQKKLDCAVKALEFYADENNWIASHSQQCPSIGNGEDVEDFYPTVKYGFIGGKRARLALEEIKK